MRALMGAVAVLVLAGLTGSAGAQDKKDKQDKFELKKLIGKWEPSDAIKGASVILEFSEKGKMAISIDLGGKAEKIEGTYKLEGDKLDMMIAIGGKEQKETVTISKLTDEEMIGKDSKGKEEKFKRVKAK